MGRGRRRGAARRAREGAPGAAGGAGGVPRMTPRLAYYGDDFSGSADVMEVLAQAGVPTRLFLDPPAAEEVVGLGAVGVAGVSRSLPTAEMEGVLRPVFEKLKALGPPLVHYKVCSTFDSSPAVGSIGRAIDVGVSVFGGPWVPLVVGAPALGRYVAFGNLFARSGQDSEVFRLDRHPTMSRHPVTPMREADLRRVLAEQTTRPVELIDAAELDSSGGRGSCRAEASARQEPRPPNTNPPVVLFDTVGEPHLAPIGRAVWDLVSRSPPAFAVGSSGLEYALAAHWREAGELPSPPEFRAPPVEQIVVVSGSCSPVTARQIEWATANRFAEVSVRPDEWIYPGGTGVAAGIYETVSGHLAAGRSVIVHTATGPDDPRLGEANDRLERLGVEGRSAELLGRFFGALLGWVVMSYHARRVCVAGGDTSGFVARELGMRSLELVAPIAPGSPLCRIRSDDRDLTGTEICFKGGQIGKQDFFELVRTGRRQT
ncbi:MAG: type III effector [Isosphaera sp.]|nr:type III effector [Isosphaera sp.]